MDAVSLVGEYFFGGVDSFLSGRVVNRGVAFVSDVVGFHRAVHCEVGV